MQTRSLLSIPGVRLISRFFVVLPQKTTERFVAPFLWGTFIFILSALPGSAYPQVTIPFADKIVHASLYTPFGFWLARAVTKRLPAVSLRELLRAFLIGAAYGLSDEFHQLFVPERSCSVADWITDCIAILVGVMIWKITVPLFATPTYPHSLSQTEVPKK
jgi:VanZ family protein